MPKKKQPTHEFGKRLMELRQQRGLTQVQLAELIGTSQRVISRYETVAEYPTVPALIALAKALRVTTDELLGLKPIASAAAEVEPQERQLWKKFRQVARLPEKDQRAVIRLINSVAAHERRPGAPTRSLG